MVAMYSQNDEERIILGVLGGQPPGYFYDVGAWDGKTFSNTLALVERGWSGVCVEPSPSSFLQLQRQHQTNERIQLLNAAIGIAHGLVEFYDCGGDAVSTLSPAHRALWQKSLPFQKFWVGTVAICDLWQRFGPAEFISLDVEGTNWELFQFIPWHWPRLKLICVEYESYRAAMCERAGYHGFRCIHITSENILLLRDPR